MGNSWHGLVILLLCFGPRSEPKIHLLGTVSFGGFDNGARCFFDKQRNISLQSMVGNMVPVTWPALRSFLTYSSPNRLFQEVHCLKKPLLFHTPHGIHSLFDILPTRPHCQVSHQGFASSVGLPRNVSVSCDLYQAIPLDSVLYSFRALAPPDCS